MPTIISTITAAGPVTKTKRDGTTFVLNEVVDGSGNVWVARKDLIPIAQSFIGQLVELVVREEQNGQYLNRYVDHVGPAPNGNAIVQAQAAQTAHAPHTAAPQAPLASAGAPNITALTGPTERDTFIFRQTAAKVAAEMSETPDEFWSNITDLVTYFQTGGTPKTIAFVTSLAGGPPPHQDEDIPF